MVTAAMDYMYFDTGMMGRCNHNDASEYAY